MSRRLQERYEQLAKPRGLWAGGKNSPHQDLSDLFVARATEQYLRPRGSFAFVMPFAVLSRRQYAGFRSGNFVSQGAGVQAVKFGVAEEFARVKPPLFPVAACVVSGERSDTPRSLQPRAIRWTGRVPDHHMGWTEASPHLHAVDDEIRRAGGATVSAYRSRFLQGTNLVPRVLLLVERQPPGPLGVPVGRVAVASARSALEKEPWRSLASLSGIVEDQFVRKAHFGSTIVAYRTREPWLAIVPFDGKELLDASDDRLDRYPGLATWWREAERLWERNGVGKIRLRDQINFQGKLAKQFPVPEHRVVYTKSGQHLAACRVSNSDAVIDQSLYWAKADSVDEARYLAAILNSDSLAKAVEGLQSRGQHNPRHFASLVFTVNFPVYDAESPTHRLLAALGEHAEHVAATVVLDNAAQFQKARRVVREALDVEGISGKIDEATANLLAA